jgi:uncharacterized protein YndB with AHSA1/START domain
MTLTLTLRRHFDVPPERVYDAWTDPALFARWIGPENIPCEVVTMQPVLGGRYDLVMIHPNGQRMEVGGTYRVLDRASRIEFTWGNPQRLVPMLITISLRPLGGGTEMDFTQHDLPSEDSLASHRAGWESTLTKLTRFLET